MTPRTPIFAANWKMNQTLKEVSSFVPKFTEALGRQTTSLEIVIAPAFVHLPAFVNAADGTSIQVGAQNCAPAKSGAFTGEVSAPMLVEIGCQWAIVGHSERRQLFAEDDALVGNRLRAALADGLQVIFCVGETLEERRGGLAEQVVARQLGVLKDVAHPERVAIAYEPVWAIGTGEVATPAQARDMHAFARAKLPSKDMRILYGGSVKPDNAGALLAEPEIDGFLVGGASLDPVGFASVIRNGLASRR